MDGIAYDAADRSFGCIDEAVGEGGGVVEGRGRTVMAVRHNLNAMSVGDVALPVRPRRKPDTRLDRVSAVTHDSILRCASEMRGKIDSTNWRALGFWS